MATETSLPDTLLVRRLFTSSIAHIIDPIAPRLPGQHEPSSLCNIKPIWPGVWLELVLDGDVLMCHNCEVTLEAS